MARVPGGQPDKSIRCDLGDLPSVSDVGAVGAQGRLPALVGHVDHDIGEDLGEGLADHEPDVASVAGVEEPVGAPGGVASGEHLDDGGVDRELREGGVEDLDVVTGMTRPGVARPQLHGQRFGQQLRAKRPSSCISSDAEICS
jgi:hypothetical protein